MFEVLNTKASPAETIFEILKTLPIAKQNIWLQKIKHDRELNHKPNKFTKAAIKEKNIKAKATNAKDFLKELLQK